jgi:hypothetical protein
MGKINIYITLVAKGEAKRPLGRRRHRLEDNIRTDLRATVGRYGLVSYG